MEHTLIFPPQHGHPAPFSKELAEPLIEELRAAGVESVIDPFAGTGRIHTLAEAAGIPVSIGFELEEEWANVEWFASRYHRYNHRIQFIGDARELIPEVGRSKHWGLCYCTSPAYGNRMADHHDAKEKCKACHGGGYWVNRYGPDDNVEQVPCEKCGGTGYRVYKRNTYKHRLGRDLTDGNSGAMQWTGKGGEEYRMLHQEVWALCVQQLREGERFILNIKDHYRKDELQPVTQWHCDCLESLGMRYSHSTHVPCKGNRQGANRSKRADYESIIVFTKE